MYKRQVQDGIVERFLTDHCPSPAFRLCEYRDRLPTTANDYIWLDDSPFRAIGGWEGGAEEMGRIARRTVIEYPWMHLTTAIESALDQFVTLRTGDMLDDNNWYTRWVLESRLPHLVPAFDASLQAAWALPMEAVNRLHVPAAYAALAGLLIVVVGGAVTRRPEAALFALFVLLALAGNAVICGALSNPSDRYQSRLVWLAALAVLSAAMRIRGGQKPLI